MSAVDGTDIRDRVTRRIIEQLEQGVLPWRKRWKAGHAAGPVHIPLRHNGTRYQGINVLILWVGALQHGRAAPIWMTYQQAQELGGQVRKGEKSQQIVFTRSFVPRSEREKPEDEQEVARVLRGYNVFNVEQIDGLPEKYYAQEHEPQLDETARIAQVETFARNTGCPVTEGGARAFCRNREEVFMPPFVTFDSPDLYYATLLHELTHWTGHESRCAREFDGKRIEAYAMEELVAELGAAFLCAELGLEADPVDEHASYIGAWLDGLRNDRSLIFAAAAHAQRAADCLRGFQPKAEEFAEAA